MSGRPAQRAVCALMMAISIASITPADASGRRPTTPPAPHLIAQLRPAHRAAVIPMGGLIPPINITVLRPTPISMTIVQSPAPPHARRDYLASDDGTLHTTVVTYSDCVGGQSLGRSLAAIDACVPGRLYFIGHNPGVFTPLVHMRIGSVITWWDGDGTPQRLRVVRAEIRPASFGAAPYPPTGVVAQFQTCKVSDGSVDWVIDAAAA